MTELRDQGMNGKQLFEPVMAITSIGLCLLDWLTHPLPYKL